MQPPNHAVLLKKDSSSQGNSKIILTPLSNKRNTGKFLEAELFADFFKIGVLKKTPVLKSLI